MRYETDTRYVKARDEGNVVTRKQDRGYDTALKSRKFHSYFH